MAVHAAPNPADARRKVARCCRGRVKYGDTIQVAEAIHRWLRVRPPAWRPAAIRRMFVARVPQDPG